ncbi:MAG: zf-HC2 domain-containing protein [Acidobacteria bacterium]|nr:zf-HC2 domain-containing protein [Candidatus Sulfomarinibacter kjeldsenii]
MSQCAEFESCADVLERLDAWIDGDLDAAEADAVKVHVDHCESCRKEHHLAEAVVAELRSMPVFNVPERVMQTVRKDTRPPLVERFRVFLDDFRIRPVPAFAAVAVVILLVLVDSPWRRPAEPQYTDQEVARAVAETRLALAYVGSVAQRAELRIKERVFDEGVAAQTVRGVRRSLRVIGEAGAATADPLATPRNAMKGS